MEQAITDELSPLSASGDTNRCEQADGFSLFTRRLEFFNLDTGAILKAQFFVYIATNTLLSLQLVHKLFEL